MSFRARVTNAGGRSGTRNQSDLSARHNVAVAAGVLHAGGPGRLSCAAPLLLGRYESASVLLGIPG